MMFALGLASVIFFKSLNKKSDEVPLQLPEIKSTSPIYVYPRNIKITYDTVCTGHVCGLHQYVEIEGNK